MKLLFKSITMLLLLTSSIFADETGSASIFSFFNGVGLEKSEVLVDGKYSYFTDEDGSVELILETGKHQIEIFAKDEKGQNLGYSKKSIDVKEGRDTQVITTFNDEGMTPKVDVDTPVGQSALLNIDESLITGTIHGTVLSTKKNLPIANARVFVKGTSIDTKTDKNGNFFVNVPADKELSISIVHSEYSAQTINKLIVKKDATINTEVKLTPASMELEEFVVLAPKVEGSIASIMAEEKNTSAIANIIGSDQMSKKGDSDAASALRRVTGVTLVGGKSIYVRGLGDRYSNVEMNSMPLPSPNPTKRVVPLDIFPAGVISSLKVQKSATADIPSSFGGGYVDVRTKDSTKEDYIKITLGLKANDSTGNQVQSYEGSTTDFLGVDDGYRDIPAFILNNSKVEVGSTSPTFTFEQAKEYPKYITNRYLSTYNESLLPGGSMALEGAYNLEIADKHTLSLFGNYKYNQEHTYRVESYYGYDWDNAADKLKTDPNHYGAHYITSSEYSHSAMFNAGYNYADVLRVKYTKLYTLTSEKLTRISDGRAGSNDSWLRRYNLNWEERLLDVDQISGDLDYNFFNVKSNFKFGLETALASLNQPGNYKYAYDGNYNLDDQKVGESYLDKGAANLFSKMNSNDKLDALYLSNKFNLDILSEDEFIDIGIATSNKDKVYTYNKYEIKDTFGVTDRMTYLTSNIDSIYTNYVRNTDANFTDSFLLGVQHVPEDYFNANVKDNSMYVNSMIKPNTSIDILIGARYVDYSQTVDKYTNGGDNSQNVYIDSSTLSINKIYPSASVKFKLNDNNHIDVAYSQTYITPDLRESSDATYFHPYDVAEVKGNPDLVNTDISSYDLKYSHYFSDTESIKLGAFYKYLDKPIEDNVIPTSTLTMYSYHNADSATLYGAEIDGRKNLEFIDSMLSRYYISGNFSYTNSNVNLTQEQESAFTSNNRQLQGLSQVVMNLTTGYDRKDRSIALSYNRMGERIRKVGLIEDGYKEFPDDVEIPPQLLDLVWIEKYENGLSFRVKIGNILNDETIWKQGDNITRKFKTDREYSFSLTYKY